MEHKEYKVVVVDDHVAIGKAIARQVNSLENFKLLYTCKNGQDLLQYLESPYLNPDIILLDVEMPIQNGIETTIIIQKQNPKIYIVGFSMYLDFPRILQMVEAGAHAYLAKDCPKKVLEQSLLELMEYDFCPTYTLENLSEILKPPSQNNTKAKLNEDEQRFINCLCEPLKPEAVSSKLGLEKSEFDQKYNQLSNQLNIKSRMGFVLYALSHGWL